MPENATLRLALTLTYDGTYFRGWAAQPGLRTCQGELERALATVGRLDVKVTVAGRTDAGVHARHQVTHVDFPLNVWRTLVREPRPTPDDIACTALARRLNSLLARQYAQWMRDKDLTVPIGISDLVVTGVSVVGPDFDARFSATGRAYTYRVGIGKPAPHQRHDVYWVASPLDVTAMNEAARTLLGEHDFLSYCKPREGSTTIRTLRRLSVTPSADNPAVIEFHVEADAFCHSMVRSLVGALMVVGQGGDPERPADLLATPQRIDAAPLAPPHGLSLEGVDYPPASEWAAQATRARTRRDQPCIGAEKGAGQ